MKKEEIELQENMALNVLNDKISLFIGLINKVCLTNFLNPLIIPVIKDSIFAADFTFAFSEIIKRLDSKQDMPTKDFMSDKYGINFDIVQTSTLSKYNQDDLINYIINIYARERLNESLQKYDNDIINGDFSALSKIINDLQNINGFGSAVKVLDINDNFNDVLDQQSELESQDNLIKVGMKGFDEMCMQKGFLVGFLAGSGSGKSLNVQKHNAKAIESGYKSIHLSLELPSKTFWSRLWTALEYVNASDFFVDTAKSNLKFTKTVQLKVMTKLRKILLDNKSFFKLSTLDKEKSCFNLAKIEKLLKTHRPDILYVDYVQLIDEDWDGMTSRTAQKIKDLAVIYDTLIIIAIQTNAEGTNLADPPFSTHIARCKNIYDACDDLVAIKGRKTDDPHINTLEVISRKARHGKFVHFNYEANMETGKWTYLDKIN